MDALKLEDKIQMLEARVNMALEISTLSLERIDVLTNKIKFAIDQEIKSEDDMDVEEDMSETAAILVEAFDIWINEKVRSVNEVDAISEFLFHYLKRTDAHMGLDYKVTKADREALNKITDYDRAMGIQDNLSVKDILNVVENTLKMKINRDFPPEVKDGPFQEHRDSICGRRTSDEKNDASRDSEENIISRRRSSWVEGRSREEKVSRSASPRYHSREPRDQSPCISITSSCVKGDEEL